MRFHRVEEQDTGLRLIGSYVIAVTPCPMPEFRLAFSSPLKSNSNVAERARAFLGRAVSRCVGVAEMLAMGKCMIHEQF
jgi:hypothetical protein